MKKPLVYTDKHSGECYYPSPVRASWGICEVSVELSHQLLMRDHFSRVCFHQKRPRQPDFTLGFFSLS